MKATIRRLLSGKATKLALLAVPTIVAVSMTAAPASAAVLAPPTGSCAPGNLCFWVDANYRGNVGHVSGNNANWSVFPQASCRTGTWNDCASALWNHGNYDAVLVYQNAGPSGGYACLAKGSYWPDLTQKYSNDGHGLNDAISSNAWLSTPSC